jgi:hypothetical protein
MPKDVVRKSIRIPDTSRASASTGGCTSGVEPRGQVGSDPGSDVVLDFVLGDCIPGIKKFVKPGSVDVVVTSPPYNLGIEYGAYDDTVARDKYLAWTVKWAEAVKDAMSDEGSFFLNIGSKPTDPWVPFEVATVLRPIFKLQNVIHWIKSIADASWIKPRPYRQVSPPVQRRTASAYRHCTGTCHKSQVHCGR